MKRFIIVMVVLAVLAGGGWWGYRTYRPTRQASAATAAVAKSVQVEVKTLLDVVNASGTIQPKTQVNLNFEISGVAAEVMVKEGQYVKAGTVLAKLRTVDLESAIKKAEIQLTQQQADLQKLFEPATAAKIAASQAKVQSAKAKLVDLQQDPNKQDNLTKAAAVLSQKGVDVQKAQLNYDAVAYRGDVGARTESQALQTATLAYEQAQADYNINVHNLEVTGGSLAESQASLAQAQADLAELLKAPNKSDVTKAQAAIKLGEITLDEARSNLAKATLVAPTDGVLLSVSTEPGERVLQDASNPAFVVADVSAYLLKVPVDEIDIGRIRAGQPVNISLDAFAESSFVGQVINVAPQPIATSGTDTVVTYEVTIEVKQEGNKPAFLPGMTAYAVIETRRLEHVLAIPNQAILTEIVDHKPIFYVQTTTATSETTRIEIKTGLRDSGFTQVVMGLQEGDTIIIPAVVKATTTSGS